MTKKQEAMGEQKQFKIPVKLIIGIAIFIFLMIFTGFWRAVTAGIAAYFLTRQVQLKPENENFVINRR